MSETLPLSQRASARHSVSYLEGLNPEQRRAVETLEGPVLVLAGAGTGKTRALTTRLAHILATGKAKPWETLTVTFTNKAAREMRERANQLVGPSAEGFRWLGTFHSIAALILRRHAELVGLKSTFTILDTDDQIRLCKQVIEAADIDAKRWTPRYLASLIDSWKNRAITPQKLPADEAEKFANGKGGALYATYQARLQVLNACDFGDLLLHNLTLFQQNQDVLEDFHRCFKYILVDEYQDTNVAQYLWLRLLAQGSNNLCCVGDDDQSIYGWRGAEVDNILRFERDFPGAEVIRLERNYRSTGNILSAASALISANQGRLGKTLWTEGEKGDKVRLRGVWDGDSEARLVADEIEAWVTKKRPHRDCAVLVRASWQMRAFEERFIMLGIPYRVIGGPRFFERAEIRDAMAYLRLMRSLADDLAFERVVNQPKRGVGAASLQKIQMAAREQGVSLMQMAEAMLENDVIKGRAKTGLKQFLENLHRWRKDGETLSHFDLAERILEESGYTDMLQADKSPQAQTRLENLKELIEAMREFETLQGFLEHVELVMDTAQSDSDDEVQILTLHAAKGLEWPYVFLPGWEEEVFPSKRSIDESGQKGLEEERRLAYVGLTRAREKAMIIFAANRQIYGRWQPVMPSRFIDDLPETHVDAASETGYGAGDMEGYGGGVSEVDRGFFEEERSFGSTYKSPGWQRAQKNERPRAKLPNIIDGSAELLATTDPSTHSFKIGDQVEHAKFGIGEIKQMEGAKLTIRFPDAGERRVIASFVKAV